MKGDSIMEENAISGDDNTHWFHSNGIITSIDNSQKKICVDIKAILQKPRRPDV